MPIRFFRRSTRILSLLWLFHHLPYSAICFSLNQENQITNRFAVKMSFTSSRTIRNGSVSEIDEPRLDREYDSKVRYFQNISEMRNTRPHYHDAMPARSVMSSSGHAIF
ncbi:hypothetical protein KC19_6G080900 [Ceratodon purpureus]|uniref:Secreted protein n=1 Tax=Ceratodon purpureus TaxID=3225 RepID=A0A8T0HEB3_CERPU|nr:hypothetical protein KC19_6G080900 [Ceratodon purpureus]